MIGGTVVTANCVHPGFVASRFGDETTGPLRSLLGLGKSHVNELTPDDVTAPDGFFRTLGA